MSDTMIDTTGYVWVNQDGRSTCNLPRHAGRYLDAAIRHGDFKPAPEYGKRCLEIITPLDQWIGFPPDFRDHGEQLECESCSGVKNF